MLRGLRWPLLVLVLAAALFVTALLTRSNETPGAAQEPVTETPAPPDIPATLAPVQAMTEAAAEPPAAPALPAPPPAPNVLVEALVGQIQKLNPLLATYNPVDRDITALIFEGLTATNDYGEIVPDLARGWTVSDDGLQYIVELRDDVLWQDGIPFTAEDVAFTMRLVADPGFSGAEALHTFWRTVEVDALDEHLVRFRLTQPLASFPDQLRLGIVPKHALEGVAAADLWKHMFNLSPIGTGPYQIEALTTSGGQIDGIQLRVAPVYRQRPEGRDGFALDRLIFRTYPTVEAALEAYQRGEVNSIGNISPDMLEVVQGLPDLSLYTGIAPRVGVLIYNWKLDSARFVRNPRVRMGLAQAVDRETLVRANLPGRAIVANSPLLPGSWAYNPDVVWPAYDPAHARELIDTANLLAEDESTELDAAATAAPSEPGEGVADAEAAPAEGADTETGAEGATAGDPAATAAPSEPGAVATAAPTADAEPEPIDLALTILTLDDPAFIGPATDIAGAWQQIGFDASIDPVDSATLQARLEAGDFDAALIELSFEPGADPDPYVFWHQGQYGSGQNYGGMDDRRVSEALEQARRAQLGIERKAYYDHFQRLFAERVPALVLYYPLYLYGADERLEGVQFNFLSTPADRFRHIRDWAFR